MQWGDVSICPGPWEEKEAMARVTKERVPTVGSGGSVPLGNCTHITLEREFGLLDPHLPCILALELLPGCTLASTLPANEAHGRMLQQPHLSPDTQDIQLQFTLLMGLKDFHTQQSDN